jgi:hypothetical protein
MTIVVNLLGGSGLGKSTTAALIFGELKLLGQSAELVQEYAKEWAWAGKKITPDDQEHISDEQYNRESRLYEKVDFIVTDSPLVLGAVYQGYYSGKDPIFEQISNRIQTAEKDGIVYMNFLLSRNKKFNPKGRFETEDQAKEVDGYLKDYLIKKQIPFHSVTSNDRERVKEIIDAVTKVKNEQKA